MPTRLKRHKTKGKVSSLLPTTVSLPRASDFSRLGVSGTSSTVSCIVAHLVLLLLLLSRFSHVWLCVTPETAACQAPPSLGLSRQEHWSGLPFPSPVHESEKGKWSRSVMSDSWRPHGLRPTRLLRPWDFPGKSAGVGCHRLLWHLMSPHNKTCAIRSI